MTDAAELAGNLEVIVRSVPGVTALYPTTPIVVTIVGSEPIQARWESYLVKPRKEPRR